MAKSLQTLFVKCYREKLESLGFKKVKGRQPYFVRVLGGEIIQVIACRTAHSGRPGEYKAFDILAGMASVYKPELDFSCAPRENLNWVEPIRYFYLIPFRLDFQDEIWRSLCVFEYKVEDEDSLRQELKRALKATEEHVLPVFNKVKDLDAFIEHIMLRRPTDLSIPEYDEDRDEFVPENDPENEGLLYIQTNNRTDLKDLFAKRYANRVVFLECRKAEGRTGYRTCEEEKMIIEKRRIETIESRDRIYNDPFVYKRALEELKKRKTANLKVLRECGIDI